MTQCMAQCMTQCMVQCNAQCKVQCRDRDREVVVAHITPTEATLRALAEFIHCVRPSWNRPGIYAALHTRCARDPVHVVAHIAIDVAMDPRVQTPGVITTHDVLWTQPALATTTPVPPPMDRTVRRQPDDVAARGAAAARAALASVQHPPGSDGAP